MPELTEENLQNMSAEEIAELQKQNCIFCKISSKEIPAKVLHETDEVMAILDINPASEGHILVFPKKHFMILPHLPDDILGKLFSVVQLMSKTLLKTFQLQGTTIFISNGMAAGQKAPHVLIHVFPRKPGDGLVKLPSGKNIDDKEISMKLKPYIEQLFGGKSLTMPVPHSEKHKNIKEAEIVEKHSRNEDKDAEEESEEESEDESDDEEIVEETKHKSVKKKEPVKKKALPKKAEPKKIEKPVQKSRPNLDDISKLLGA